MRHDFLAITILSISRIVGIIEVKAFIDESVIKTDKIVKLPEDFAPTHTISARMLHKLIHFRIQSKNGNSSSDSSQATTQFTPAVPQLPYTTISVLIPDATPQTADASLVGQDPPPTDSLCLPSLSPPVFLLPAAVRLSAPPHEISYPPPVWLRLPPHKEPHERHHDQRHLKPLRDWLKRVDPASTKEIGFVRAARSAPAPQIIQKEPSEDIYMSRIGRAASGLLSAGDGGDRLQIVHPPAPNERNWVMVSGNESAVNSALAVSLSFGGRLASMGFYRNERNELQYYAIMHRFNGPVFLKPDPITLPELMKMAKENEELDLGLTQLCGQDDGEGKILFNTYWERILGVSFHIWFPGSPASDEEKKRYEKDGYRLVNICGYSAKDEAHYVGVWQKPAARVGAYEARYGISLQECLALNEKLKAKEFVATQFRVFNNVQDVLCAAIWEHVPGGRQHFIEIGDDLHQMYQRHATAKGAARLPRQISHFIDAATRHVNFVVLWSDVHSFRYPDPPDVWLNKSIPVNYLAGSREQLNAGQLEFISKRVERFMRELDIPGLSLAISCGEQLKFAAGYGYGNVRRREAVEPGHQFRIGSVSKPITAVAIMILVERGRLRLEQRVFGGLDSIFGDQFAKHGQYRKYVTEITVRHLLEHTSGGWNNVDSDPAWLAPSKSTAELVAQVLDEQPLVTRPGNAWIYSNFGYQILGLIIERTSGLDYERFVLENVWWPVGVRDIRVARSALSEKSSREVLYCMSGNKVGLNPYEILPPERTGPWGGWIASPIELLQLMSHIDGFKRKNDILTEKSMRLLSEPSRASNLTYGLGWSLNIMGFNGWQHDGRMPGSASMLVRLDNGLEMAVVVNKEYSERDFFHELGYILHHIGNNCNWWTDTRIDLFNSTSFTYSPVSLNGGGE